jgi:hypothetical protein
VWKSQPCINARETALDRTEKGAQAEGRKVGKTEWTRGQDQALSSRAE